jgi:uncharacterized lipoprotein YehR (DUF1307 family)
MMSLAIILTAIFVIFGFALLPDDAYTDMPGNFCYNQDMEGYICFDTLKMCEREQTEDLLAESECYEDMPGDFCYNQEMEGNICFDTLKMCEREENDDLLAESECYED